MKNSVVFSTQRLLIGFILIGFIPIWAAVLFPGPVLAEQGNVFTGSWILNGERQILPFGKDRNIYTFTLSGHVNLEKPAGATYDFWSQCMGFADTQNGTQARCVWRSLDGEQIFISLKSPHLGTDNLVSGTIEGGTGKFSGVKGELAFKWFSLFFHREAAENTISGQALDLKGSYVLPAHSSSGSEQ